MSVAKLNLFFDWRSVTALTVDAYDVILYDMHIQICHVSSVMPNAVDSAFETWKILCVSEK